MNITNKRNDEKDYEKPTALRGIAGKERGLRTP